VGGVAQRRVIENVTFDYYLCDMMKRRLARFQSRFPFPDAIDGRSVKTTMMWEGGG